MTKEFQNQRRVHLSESNIRVIAGVSGGPDSMAMLYILHRFDVDTVVVHCNYQLRGTASDKDQELVEGICMHWNMECVSVRFDSKQESEGNFQDWARQRRYQAFEDIRQEYNAELILTAHHQDDQLETILQKILRGAGLTSWKGMNVLDGYLFRPLLNISKSDIMEFVEECNVPYRIDRTNEESTYARNFIRNHWFPDLNRLFPGWKENLQRVADRAEEFKAMSDLILDKISEGEEALNREKFLELDPKIRPVILLQFIKDSGIEADVSQGFLDNINKLANLQSGKKVQISDQFYMLRDRSFFKIIDASEDDFITQKIQKKQLKTPLQVKAWTFSIEDVPDQFTENILHLDFDQLTFPLTLRTWKSGDIFQPLGLDGSQLVSDHLTNRKISSLLKRRVLVLESFDRTICALIFPANSLDTGQAGSISEKVRCTSSTTRTLKIKKID